MPAWALLVAVVAAVTQTPKPPNVVLILADDMGYSDLACYGGEIQTPNLDSLAAGGVRFTQFTNTARCWPTRAAILTGYYPQQVRRDQVEGVASGTEGKRPAWAQLLPALLKRAGYRSYHSGKWHIDGMPLEGGFDRSYYIEDCGRNFHPREHYRDDKKLEAVPPGGAYYSTTRIVSEAVDFLKQHEAEHREQPFFLYVAFIVPHFPLQAPAQDIARYHGKYDAGWEEIRASRWRRIDAMGLVRGVLSPVERNLGPPNAFKEMVAAYGPGEVDRPIVWSDLTVEQQRFQASKMEIHAAMVDRMDREIGRILEQLKAMGVADDTLVAFLSDNGASAEILVRDDGHDRSAPPGSAATHLCLGPGWSTVANTPFRRHKTWVHQGGVATPLIVRWPAGIAARGEIRQTPGHVIDLLPTILELAGLRNEAAIGGPERPGRSLLKAFQSDEAAVGGNTREFWWSHVGNRAIRVGDWRLVSARDTRKWELFDLANDRTETHDLASEQPQRVEALSRRWDELNRQYSSDAKQDLTTKSSEAGEAK